MSVRVCWLSKVLPSPQSLNAAREPRFTGFQPVVNRSPPVAVVPETPRTSPWIVPSGSHVWFEFKTTRYDEAERHLGVGLLCNRLRAAKLHWRLVGSAGTVAQNPAAMSLLCVRGKVSLHGGWHYFKMERCTGELQLGHVWREGLKYFRNIVMEKVKIQSRLWLVV